MTNTRLPRSERRSQLLTVARRVLAQSGFHETSMNQIAEEAGVTKPVLYQHFASKRDLYQAVLTDVGERLGHAVFDAATAASSPREQVEAGFRGYLAFVEEDWDGFSVLFSGTSREDSEWAEIARGVEGRLAEQIADLIAVDGMDAHHRRALAHGVVGLAEGMVRFWQTNDTDLNVDDLLRDLTTLAYAGLRGLEP